MNAASSPESGLLAAADGSMSDAEADIRQRYADMRSAVTAGASITVLHVGAEYTAIATGAGPAEAASTIVLAIGSQKTGREHFRHDLPTPGELEIAIQIVEDELMRARMLAASASVLYTTDADARTIGRLVGLPDGTEVTITLDAMEQAFGRLAAITLGRPASQDEMPTNAALAATLLILREFMHVEERKSDTATSL